MAKKAAPKAAEPKATPPPKGKAAAKPKRATKAELFGQLSEKTGSGKKEVTKIFEALTEIIGKELGKKGPGQFVIPGLLKLRVVRKPATKDKPSITPFTKEPMIVKAKPARN